MTYKTYQLTTGEMVILVNELHSLFMKKLTESLSDFDSSDLSYIFNATDNGYSTSGTVNVSVSVEVDSDDLESQINHHLTENLELDTDEIVSTIDGIVSRFMNVTL